MVAHTNALKSFVGSFRSRMHIMQELSEVYRGDVLRGREKLTQLKEIIKEKADRAAKSELARKMRIAKGYYTLEMAPPTKAEEMKRLTDELRMFKEFVSTGCYKDLTVKQAWLLFLVGLEVWLWFYLGETIGKFHIVGYKVCP